jgi:hypothetical protein
MDGSSMLVTRSWASRPRESKVSCSNHETEDIASGPGRLRACSTQNYANHSGEVLEAIESDTDTSLTPCAMYAQAYDASDGNTHPNAHRNAQRNAHCNAYLPRPTTRRPFSQPRMATTTSSCIYVPPSAGRCVDHCALCVILSREGGLVVVTGQCSSMKG